MLANEKYTSKLFALKNWLEKQAHRPGARYVLIVVAFLESAFAPVPPPDILFVPMVIAEPKKWKKLTFTVVAASVCGGLFGYFIGGYALDLFEPYLASRESLKNSIDILQTRFDKNAGWTVFVGAFTLLPYKIFAISAGLFKVNFLEFILASVLGRGARFLLEGYFASRFGQRAVTLLIKYINIFTGIFIVGGLVYFFFYV